MQLSRAPKQLLLQVRTACLSAATFILTPHGLKRISTRCFLSHHSMQVPAWQISIQYACAVSILLLICTAAAEAEERAAAVEGCEKRLHRMERDCTQRIEAAVCKAEHRFAQMLLGSCPIFH